MIVISWSKTHIEGEKMIVSAIETIEKVANGVALQFLSEEERKCIRYFFGDDFVYAKASLFIKQLKHKL